jgi:hypothetical protein
MLSHLSAKIADSLSAVLVALRIGGYLHDAQVHPDDAFAFIDSTQGRVFPVTDCHQVELSLDQTKLGLASSPLQKLLLMFSTDKGNLLSTVHGPDRDKGLGQVIAQDSIVEGNGPVWPERPESIPINLVGIGDFGKEEDSDLSSESFHDADGGVHLSLQVESLEVSRGEGVLRDSVGRSIGLLQRSLECLSLLLRGQELDLCDELHRCQCITIVIKMQINQVNFEKGMQENAGSIAILHREAVAFLPTAEAGGVLQRLW